MRSVLPLFALPIFASAPALATEQVAVPAFRSLELRGGGQVTIRPGPVQRITLIEGSSRITRFRVERDGQLKVDVCDNNCPRNYRLRIDVESPHVPDVAIAGGGSIQAVGNFAPQRQLSAAIKGGGKIDVLAVQAANVHSAIHGGGQISVRASASLAAAVNGGGHIRYAGNPQLSSAINGGGSVDRIN
jgi:hypothetical protein